VIVVAHIGGVPVEESLLTFSPVAGVFAFAVTARLREVNAWRRRRRRDEN
jgi:hypothetical protein